MKCKHSWIDKDNDGHEECRFCGKGKTREVYLKCPRCGSVIKKSKLMELIEFGGDIGMCYCQYLIDKTFVSYKRTNKKEYERVKKLK